jgi:hypothetical protein
MASRFSWRSRTGDANLDGVVDNDDVAVIAANYAPDKAPAALVPGRL